MLGMTEHFQKPENKVFQMKN